MDSRDQSATEAATAVKASLETHEWWLAGNLGVPGMKEATTYKCLCGWNGDDPRGHQAGQTVAALATAGFAVVQLPDPEAKSPYSWLEGSVTATCGLGRVRLYQEDHRLTSVDAREVAASLLAAADAADSPVGLEGETP